VFVFGGLDRLEIPRFGSVGHVPQGWGAMIPSQSGYFMELTAEGGQVGRPPRLGAMRVSGDWRVFFQTAVSQSNNPASHPSRSVGEGHGGAEGI